jgi:hypothetical protein
VYYYWFFVFNIWQEPRDDARILWLRMLVIV